MFAVIVGLASLGLAAAVLPDSVIEWLTSTAGDLVMLVLEPIINILLTVFDGVRAVISNLFFG